MILSQVDFRYEIGPQIVALLICLSFLVVSCDSFLSTSPKSFNSKNETIQNPDDFESLLNGAYNRLRGQAPIAHWESMYMLEIRTDAINRQFNVNLPFGDRQGQQMEEWTMTTSNQGVVNQWSNIYETIQQTNVILQNIDDIDFDNEDRKSSIKGEAQFIRALSYWFAVQYWGGVPIQLSDVNSRDASVPEGGRSSESEVYQQIISDLNQAISNLPNSSDQPGRADEGAARFLLGKTYLLTGNLSESVDMLDSVVSDFNYSLLPNYSDVWNPNNTNNSESIFEFQFTNDVANQPHSDLIEKILPFNSSGVFTTTQVEPLGWYHPSIDILEMFDSSSERYSASIFYWENSENSRFNDVVVNNDSIPIINKFFWPDQINNEGEQDGNIILFRFSDALLSLAEAYWREDPSSNQDRILSLVNRVRNRAGLDDVDLNNVTMPSVLEGTSLENDPLGRAIFVERSVELFAEGHRLLDLKRYGEDFALTVMQNYSDRRRQRESRVSNVLNIQKYKLLFPIPAEEVGVANIQQNPGW